MRYKFIGRNGRFYLTEADNTFSMKLNFNCPKDYKDGNGEGSCKGYKPSNVKETTNQKKSKSTSVLPKKTLSVLDSINSMKPGEVWNAGPVGDIKVDKISGDKITVTANNFTETMSKKQLYNNLKSYTVIRRENVTNPLNSAISNIKSTINKIKKEKKSGKISRTSKVKLVDQINKLKDIKSRNISNQINIINPSVENFMKQVGSKYNMSDVHIVDSISSDYIKNNLNNNISNKINKLNSEILKMKIKDNDEIENKLFDLEEEIENNGYDSKLSLHNTNQLLLKKMKYTGSMVHLSKSDKKAAELYRSKESNNIKSMIKYSTNAIESDDNAKYAFQEYTGETYKRITPILAGKNSNDYNIVISLPLITKMDEIFNKSTTTTGMTVWRGASNNEVSRILSTTNKKSLNDIVGSEIPMPIYTSTTRNSDIGKEFADKNGIVYEINLPKGSKALALDNISRVTNEYEVLLGRNSKFIVDSVDTSKSPTIVKVTCKW